MQPPNGLADRSYRWSHCLDFYRHHPRSQYPSSQLVRWPIHQQCQRRCCRSGSNQNAQPVFDCTELSTTSSPEHGRLGPLRDRSEPFWALSVRRGVLATRLLEDVSSVLFWTPHVLKQDWERLDRIAKASGAQPKGQQILGLTCSSQMEAKQNLSDKG